MPDFIHASHMAVGRNWSAVQGRHRHDYAEIVVMVRGGIRVHVAGIETEAFRGDVLCYRPGVAHQEWSIGKPAEFVWISVTGERDLPDTTVVRSRGDRIVTLALWLAQERNAHDAGRESRRSTLLQALLLECARQAEPEIPPALERVRDYMREHLAGKLTLDALAAQARISRYHFVRWYKRHTGRTPMQDLRRMRIDAACDLMRSSSAPLKQIADRTGFCDEYYFSRVFREHVGISPGAFRQKGNRGTCDQ